MAYKVPFYKQSKITRLSKLDYQNFDKLIENATLHLEQKFASIYKSSHILSVNNPSSAIHLAMCAIDLKRGDKVLCAVNAYVDIAEAIRHFDSEPIFVDIEPKSYHINIKDLEQKIKQNYSKKLRAIVVNHFAGLRVQIEPILKLAQKYNLKVIEDFSNAPIMSKSEKLQSDIAIYSLNFRLDNTLKGAILAFRDSNEFERAKLLREHGLVHTNKELEYLYDIVDIGCDYRLDELSAYLLDGFFEDRMELIKRKQAIAKLYLQELKNIDAISLPIESKEHLYTYFIIEVNKNRDHFARELKKRGVEVGLQYIPLHFTSYYKNKYKLKVTSFPNALNAYQKVLSLPCHGKMSDEDARYVIKQVKEVAKEHI